jgi:hypothetical protein
MPAFTRHNCLAKTLSVPEINNFTKFPQSQDLL